MNEHSAPEAVRPRRREAVQAVQLGWVATLVLTVALASVGFVDGWSRPNLLGGPVADLIVDLGLPIGTTIVVGLIVPLTIFVTLACFVFWRRPQDRMAGLFGIAIMAFGAVTTRSLGVAFVTRPILRPAIVLLCFVAMIAVGLLLATFPDGRGVPRFGLLAPVLMTAGIAVYPGFVEAQLGLPDLPAAAGRFNVASGLGSAGILVGVAAQVGRFLTTAGLARQQVKWVIAPLGAFLLVTTLALLGSVTGLLTERAFALALLAVAPWGLLMPLAWARAILRYRVYEIDRLISRTVTYACVVVVLGAVWVTAVIGLGTMIAPVVGARVGDLAVAAATLAAVVLFLPVRSRVQAAVDRRFNRTGYQAQQAVDSFPERIRAEIDLDAIADELASTAVIAVQPARASVWLATPTSPSDQGTGRNR